MVGYKVNTRGGFLSIGHNNLGFGISGKASRVGLSLGPSDSGLDCSKSEETRRRKTSSRCRWRNPVASMLVRPSDRVCYHLD